MRPPPKSDSPQKPSKALGNVFAVDTPKIEEKPSEKPRDDATFEVSETPSGTINLDELDPDAEALAAAASASIPAPGAEASAPVLRDSRGQPYDGSITGTQDGMFAAFDDQNEAPAEAASSASQPAEDLLRKGFGQELHKWGIELDPEVKLTKSEIEAFQILLKNGRWPWTDDLSKLKRRLVRFLSAAFAKEVMESLPTFEKETAPALAKELVKLLRAKDLRAVANRVEQGMPKSLKAGPPPLPPDSKK